MSVPSVSPIPGVIQKSEFNKAGAQNLDQTLVDPGAGPVDTQGRYREAQRLGYEPCQNRFSNHERYNSRLIDQEMQELVNEQTNRLKEEIKKLALKLLTGFPWVFYVLRVSKESAGGWGAVCSVFLKTIFPGIALGCLSRVPQTLSDRLIKACEPREHTYLSKTVFRVIKSTTACGLFVAGTSFAVNAYQRATSAFNRHLILGVYGMFSQHLMAPKLDQSLCVYSLFPKAETLTNEKGGYHPMASLAVFISELWILTSWKGSPILAFAGIRTLGTLVNISCRSFAEKSALV